MTENQIILNYLRDKVKELREVQKNTHFIEAGHLHYIKHFLREEIRELIALEKLIN